MNVKKLFFNVLNSDIFFIGLNLNKLQKNKIKTKYLKLELKSGTINADKINWF